MPCRYYRDRLSVPRGPCNMWALRDCWSAGVIDENTLVWGQGLADWLPVKNVRMLIPQIRTPEGETQTLLETMSELQLGPLGCSGCSGCASPAPDAHRLLPCAWMHLSCPGTHHPVNEHGAVLHISHRQRCSSVCVIDSAGCSQIVTP